MHFIKGLKSKCIYQRINNKLMSPYLLIQQFLRYDNIWQHWFFIFVAPPPLHLASILIHIPSAEGTISTCIQIKFAGGFIVRMVAHFIAAFLTGRTLSTNEIQIRFAWERQKFALGVNRLYKEVNRPNVTARQVVCNRWKIQTSLLQNTSKIDTRKLLY